MYRAEQKEISTEDGMISVWGVADESGFILDFTTDNITAEEFIDVLNKNNIERRHILEIIEDCFYSG